MKTYKLLMGILLCATLLLSQNVHASQVEQVENQTSWLKRSYFAIGAAVTSVAGIAYLLYKKFMPKRDIIIGDKTVISNPKIISDFKVPVQGQEQFFGNEIIFNIAKNQELKSANELKSTKTYVYFMFPVKNEINLYSSTFDFYITLLSNFIIKDGIKTETTPEQNVYNVGEDVTPHHLRVAISKSEYMNFITKLEQNTGLNFIELRNFISESDMHSDDIIQVQFIIINGNTITSVEVRDAVIKKINEITSNLDQNIMIDEKSENAVINKLQDLSFD